MKKKMSEKKKASAGGLGYCPFFSLHWVTGARRKVFLHIEAYAWALVLGVFDKLREVGVSSYLSFTLCLSVFMMLELIEAVSGRLIGPKSWNRIARKFSNQFVQSVTAHGRFELLGFCFVL